MAPGQLQVHEVRFFDPKPRAIHGLAFERKSKRLAVVRCDISPEGEYPVVNLLEIWNLRDGPCLEFKIDLDASWRQSVEAVCWRSSRRLFLSGMHGHVLLIDVRSGKTLRTAAAVSGPVWCLGLNPSGTLLCAGTEDGYVSIFDVEDDEKLEYTGLLEPRGSRILALSWHPGTSKNLLATSGRGRIWVWDMESRALKTEMRPLKKGRDEPIVSSVLFLGDGTIVSGDSTGATTFWDSAAGTILMTFTGHKSGVLALAACELPDGMRIYSSGIDPVIYEFKQIQSADQGASWIQTVPRHYHTHDVRAMCCAGKKLVSGGQDTYLIMMAYQPQKLFIKVPPTTEAASVWSTVNYRASSVPLLLARNSTSLELWKLSSAFDSPYPDYALLLNFDFAKGREMITVAAVSEKTEWLIAGNSHSTRVYRMILSKDLKSDPDINVLPVLVDEDVFDLPAQQLYFTPSGKLIVGDERKFYVCLLKNKKGSTPHSMAASVTKTCHVGNVPPGERVRCLGATDDCRFVAVSLSDRTVIVYDCESAVDQPMEVDEPEDDDGRPSAWKTLAVPRSSSLVVCLAFTKKSPFHLILCYADGTVAVFDPLSHEYYAIDGIDLTDRNIPLTHISTHGDLAVLHSWKEGCLLKFDDGKWVSRRHMAYEEHLIANVFAPGGQLVNVVQTPTMIQNYLPSALARKVFGV